ncbi:(2Fe-2S)-binding protein [Streptomyces oceani]|uniref:Iron reductase n=1 Tax=Streptomyces oceani TaxID=1075402 RepID=A0A1E7KKY8_9ACTN|nr:(2Fe-2S)-binding protein [Streptomyces oceani]OEV04605.1 iron reductase [Streptomyces oceani]
MDGANARAPAGEVLAALDASADHGGFFVLPAGGSGQGWHPVADSYARGFRDQARAVAERHRTSDQRVGVSIAQLGHAARLWSPSLACVLLHGVVLDLSTVHRADEGPGLWLPRAAGWYADRLPDVNAALYGQVMGHLDALAKGLRVRVAPRLLDGNAASALVEAARTLLAAHPGLRDPLTSTVTELLTTGRLAGTGQLTGPDLTFRRRSCCLYYRAPNGTKCADCCLADRGPRPG